MCFLLLPKKFQKKKLRYTIEKSLIESFGSFAIPKDILFVNSIPKTRSGKILRRIIKEILLNKNKSLGDMSTILDKSSLNQIIDSTKTNYPSSL